MNERIRIGQRIRELRHKRGMFQSQLAEISGITNVNVSRIEAGKYSAGLDVLAKIASALGCDIDFIEKENNFNNLKTE